MPHGEDGALDSRPYSIASSFILHQMAIDKVLKLFHYLIHYARTEITFCSQINLLFFLTNLNHFIKRIAGSQPVLDSPAF